MIKQVNKLGERTTVQEKVSSFRDPWTDFTVKKMSNPFRTTFNLEDLASETLLTAESHLTLVGTSFTIRSNSESLGKLISNMSGSHWYLKNTNDQKILEITYKKK